MTAGRPIFVVGCPRSGTTLLQVMLHAHPNIAVPPENRYVLPAYYRRAEWGNLNEPANRRALARFLTGRGTRFADFHLPRKRVRQRIAAGPPTVGSALEIMMQEFAADAGADRWCDKRPFYIAHVRALLRMFPDAQFVHLVRDGRATTASLLRMRWWNGGLDKAVGTWRYSIRAGHAWRRRLPTDSWLDLRYEDLLAAPEPQLQRLCEFLGERFDPAMLAQGSAAAEVVPERKTWHSNTAGPLLPERAEAWRSELSRSDVALIEFVAGRELRALGYPTSNPAPRPSVRRVAVFTAAETARTARLRARAVVDAVAARRERFPVASQFSSHRAGR